MAENSIVEFRAFSSPEDRSLLFGLLFSGLVGYREAHPAEGLAHVTVLEEAHRLLRASASGSFAASLFADAIAELRGAGEGFIIVDQAPSGLIPEASKNTGTKIAHRLLDREERDLHRRRHGAVAGAEVRPGPPAAWSCLRAFRLRPGSGGCRRGPG